MSPFLWWRRLDVQVGWSANEGQTTFQGYKNFQIGKLIILWRWDRKNIVREMNHEDQSKMSSGW